MVGSPGERKCALLLTTLHRSDRRRLLAELPESSAATIRALLARLDRLPFAVADLANALLAEPTVEAGGRSPTVSELLTLAERLPAPWFARVLGACAGTDHSFVLAMLDASLASQVRNELERLPSLPAAARTALLDEATALLGHQREAA